MYQVYNAIIFLCFQMIYNNVDGDEVGDHGDGADVLVGGVDVRRRRRLYETS